MRSPVRGRVTSVRVPCAPLKSPVPPTRALTPSPPGRTTPSATSPEGPTVPWYVVAIGAATLLLVGGAAAGLLIARRRRLPAPDAVEPTREPLAPEPGAGKPEPDATVAPPPDAVEAALQELIAEHRARQGDLAERT